MEDKELILADKDEKDLCVDEFIGYCKFCGEEICSCTWDDVSDPDS